MGATAEAEGTFAVQAAPANNEPAAKDAEVTATKDQPLQGQLTGTDADEDQLTYAVDKQPEHGKVVIDPDTGKFTYTPNEGYTGPDSFTFTVNDGQATSAPGTISITVTEAEVPNREPIANGKNVTATKDQPLQGQLTGTDADEDPLTYAVAKEPEHGKVVIDPDTGKFTYTPNEGYTGPDSFTFTVNDGQATSAPGTISITVTEAEVPNREPIANGKNVTATKDQPLQGQLTGTDADEDQLTYAVDKQPEHGKVVIDPDTGKFTYTPNEGYTGPDSFTFTVNDGQATSAPGTVSIDVQEAPVQYTIDLKATPDRIVANGKSQSILTAIVKDKDGNPVSGVPVDFTAAPYGRFVDEKGVALEAPVVTTVNGVATIRYQSEKTNSKEPVTIQLQASVNDPVHGLQGRAGIELYLEPAVIAGVITNTNPSTGDAEPVAGATVTIRDDEGNIVATVTTAGDGSYSVPITDGNRNYWAEITRTVGTGDQTCTIVYKQKVSVNEEITGEGQVFPSSQTITGIVGAEGAGGKLLPIQFGSVGTPEGNQGAAPAFKAYLVKPDGTYVDAAGYALSADGVFVADGLPVDPSIVYGLEIRYEYDVKLPDGKVVRDSVVLNKKKNGSFPELTVGRQGEMNINEELIDPFGIITDAKTGLPIKDAKVVLTYSNTKRNKDKKSVPGTQVVLPKLPGFAPSDNANPQYSDALGNYAFMVYGDTDYTITATRAGYKTYKSTNIEVNDAIVHWDFSMQPIGSGGGSGGGSSGGTDPGTPATEKPEEPKDVDSNVTLNVSVDRSTYQENSQATVVVSYTNGANAILHQGKVTLTLPEGAVVLDAAGGTVEGNAIVWTVEELAAGQTINKNVKIQFPSIDVSGKTVELKGQFASEGKAVHPENAAASVKVLLFSNRFGEISHERYILGYPDGTFKAQRSLTRSELAAIVARLINGGNTDKKASYSDVSNQHWASGYISIATENGIFTGYEDGRFRPDQAVTREELAAVMVRYLKLEAPASISNHFSDTAGRWSSAAIEALYRNGMIQGYVDGTFHPDNEITRLEAVVLINRMLFRGPLADAPQSFPDFPAAKWGFGDVEEATVSHDATRNEDGSEKFVKQREDNVH
ncbi:Ig-like domain-containing protein [Cohnella xylanilytica]|uniref:Ig-like domain-containing protein n=1 Tax=Cohnella xylanilytica TaxID=557555 RepID=UPI001BB427B2|nr:Ig-like domain-containing protein [Cohnella xylanilytica]